MTKDYRSAALAARAAAQAKLRSLREARRRGPGRAGRSGAAEPSPVAPAHPPPAGDGLPEPAPAEPVAAPAIRVSSAAEDLSRLVRGSGAEEPPQAPPPDRDADRRAHAPSAAPVARPQQAVREGPGTGDAARRPDACPADDRNGPTQGAGLSGLPGIGPGLIALFANAGIHSLDDLAGAEPTPLRDALGLAGQFLDIEAWIDAARRETGRQSSGGAAPGTPGD